MTCLLDYVLRCEQLYMYLKCAYGIRQCPRPSIMIHDVNNCINGQGSLSNIVIEVVLQERLSPSPNAQVKQTIVDHQKPYRVLTN